MISCTFRMFGSDSLIETIPVQSIPCVGEKICIGSASYDVVEVQHEISFDPPEQKIVVTYKAEA